MKNIVVDKGSYLFLWVKKIEVVLNCFYLSYNKLPKEEREQLFIGTRSRVLIDPEGHKAFWGVGMNTINIVVGDVVSLFFNGTREKRFTYPLFEEINDQKRKEIINILTVLCGVSPN